MRLNLRTVCNILSVVVLASFPPLMAAETAPLSPQGKQRLQSELKSIEESLEKTRANMEVSEKNQRTIEGSLKDLALLDQEHQQLKQRYENYLSNARVENQRNEKALQEILEFEKKRIQATTPGTTMTPEQEADLARANKEKSERETWASETSKKMAKISQLLASANQNLQQISAKRKGLLEQRNSWIEKQQQHYRLHSEISNKKASIERLLAEKK